MSTFHFVSKGVGSNYLWRYRERLIPDAYQKKISTVWAVCEKQHLNLTWILVLFAFSKTEFFLKKKVVFSIQTVFMCLNSVSIGRAFSCSEGNTSYLVQEKRPKISSKQNICPWQVKHRFKSLTWFCSLAGECLDHSTEKGVCQSVSFFQVVVVDFSPGRERLSLFCYSPASCSDELISAIVKCVFLQYSPTLERSQHRILP